jgi:hypothetical protein
MVKKGIFQWLTLDMVVFAAANAFLILCFGDKFSALNDVGYFKLLVFGLAVFRAANILSNETVTKPLRAPFVEESRKGGKLVQQPKKTGFLGAMGLLIYCPSCTGVWLAAALVYFYIFYPAPTFVVALFLALSAVERIISFILERLKK